MNGNLDGDLYYNIDSGNLCLTQNELVSNIILDAKTMIICGEEFKNEDFKILKIILNKRRENMYSLYEVFFVDRETLNWDMQYGMGKTEISAVNAALAISEFADFDLDDLTYKTILIISFEKKKKLKDAVDEIKKALE